MLLQVPPTLDLQRRVAITTAGLLWIVLAGSLVGCGSMSASMMNASGRGYYDSGNFAAARQEFARAVADDPENAHYAYNLARSLQGEGQHQAAEHQFRRAIALDPRHQPAYHHLASLMTDQGRSGEAMQILQHWAGSQPFVAESHLEVAALSNRLGDYTTAEQSLQQALQVKPGHPKALAHLGDVYQKTGRAQEAVSAYAQSLKMDPSQVALQSRIASLTTPADQMVAPRAQMAMPRSPRESLAMLGGRPGPRMGGASYGPAGGALPRSGNAPQMPGDQTQLADGFSIPNGPRMSMAGLPLAQPMNTPHAQRSRYTNSQPYPGQPAYSSPITTQPSLASVARWQTVPPAGIPTAGPTTPYSAPMPQGVQQVSYSYPAAEPQRLSAPQLGAGRPLAPQPAVRPVSYQMPAAPVSNAPVQTPLPPAWSAPQTEASLPAMPAF